MSGENTPIHPPFPPANSFSTSMAQLFAEFRGTMRQEKPRGIMP
jgi:hypothetical protein